MDLDASLLRRTDMAIVSLHTKCIPAGGAEGYTHGLIEAMKNPYVNIIGHPDSTAAIPWTTPPWSGPPPTTACCWR